MILILADAIILILDMGMWLLDGKSGFLLREIYILVTAFYYVFNPLICMIWYFYVDYKIYKSASRLKRVLVPMLVPAAVNAALSLVSIFSGHMFFFDAENIYYRGPFFPLMAVISLFYLVYAMILLIAKKNLLEKREFLIMLVFGIPPLVGGVVQSLVYGLSLVWICATFSALIIFINMQNNQLYTDHLTGLFNRRQLDSYLRQNSQTMENGMLAGVMIDLNSFKQINDQYGHNIGDQALQHTAEILTKTFRERDFIARYGGDEFLILMIIHDRRDLENAIQRLKENARRFNEQSEDPYQISLSIGYDCRSLESEQEVNDFLKHIDQLMYEDKQRQQPA